MSKQKIIILVAVLVDVIGFGIVIPILPFYVTEFGASPTVVTLLFSTFSFFAFLSAPLLGALSDRMGRRPILILSMASTAVGWFVFANANTLWLLFLGRIIDGSAAGNFTIAQSFMVDISENERERTTNLGLIGATFGIGFILGPLLGGILSTVSHSFPFLVAGILAALNAVGAFFILPETHHTRDSRKKISLNPLRPLIRAAKDLKLRHLYMSWGTFSIAFVIGQSVFALFVRDVFGFSAYATGLSFTVVGLVVAFNQGVLLKRYWLDRFTDHQLTMMMMIILACALGMIALENLPLFYVALIGLGTGQAVLRVVMTSQVAGASSPAEKGETMGILSAIMSASMVVAPIVSGALFEIDHAVPYVLAVVVILVGLAVAAKHPPAATPQG